jgi:hypothetical protein
MRLTLDDLVAEIRDNFKAILADHAKGGSTCSWTVTQPEGVVLTISALNLVAEPPVPVGVTVRLDAAAQNIEAEYFGFNHQRLSFPIPRLANGVYDLSDDSPLFQICQRIFEPLSRVRCH